MMNHSARVTRRPRRAWLRPAHTVVPMITAAVLGLLATACGGSPSSAGRSPDAGGSADPPSAVAYSHCVRSHGVPNFPDPPSGGGVPKVSAQELGVSNSRLQAAYRSCQRPIPATGGSVQQQEQRCYVAGNCPPALTQQMLNAARTFARCMRSHAVPNFPDPSTDSQGRIVFNISAHGISDSASHSPQFTTKLNECQREAGNFPYGMG
jgi:hypothetical protein